MQVKLGVRGQSMGIDLLFAIAITLMVLVAMLAIWGNSSAIARKQGSETQIREMSEKAMDTLVGSRGVPSNWEQYCENDTNAIGLAKRNMILDLNKVDQFVLRDSQSACGWGTSEIRERLYIADNNYFFRLIDPKTSLTLQSEEAGALSAGIDPAQSELPHRLLQAKAIRIVTYNGGDAIAELTLHRIE